MPRRTLIVTTVMIGVALATACTADDDPGAAPTEPTAEPTRDPGVATPTTTPTTAAPDPAAEPGPVEPDEFTTITTGLDVPWDLVFLPDGSALVSERNTARILRVSPDGETSQLGEVPDVRPDGEGGLLGIALGDDSLYAYYTAAGDNRVVRMPFDGQTLGEPEVIIDGIPKAGRHNGGRMVFGPDGALFVATGDASNQALAQDLDSLGGKILRLNPDGTVPDDNPFDGSPVWSYGHRNVQGLAFDDEQRLWASEFGTRIWDELNIIEPGENYGWPMVEGQAGDDRFVDPVVQWPTADASPSGIAYVRDTIFLAGLRGQRLWQVPIPGGEAGSPEAFAGEYGRLRHVALAPDGSLWILTSNTDGRLPGGPSADDDRILRATVG